MMRRNSAEDGSALRWFKSSYSDSSNSNECVQLAIALDAVHARDSKNADGPQFAVAREAWADVVSYAAGR
ncbi:DUF397 domain-containing protein [Streptomyces xanthochromogenes]|uniref:DUF397 domain-containing protein n=1 Tax=Streptomyces xanthochromogenes TaxID=67384 RepID=UPI003798C466